MFADRPRAGRAVMQCRSSSDRQGERGPKLCGTRWELVGVAAVAALALSLFTWSLSRNGMGNAYYAAAAKSATISWKAFLFGSLDPGSFITVDKPPVAIWVMALSARVFGFSSWSILLPQALAGVGSVLILHRLVRRWAGKVAALLAALALALTPVAVLMFRFNDPDAFLTFLLLVAAWAVWTAVESGSTWRLAGAGVVMGSAFLTKMLAGLVVLPTFALVYLLCGPPRLGRRILQLALAGAAAALSAGWWIAIVGLWPDGSRPYVGGTTTNSWIDLIFSRSGGYLDTTSVQAAALGGDPGLMRIFNHALGGQVSWFIPLALVGLVAGLWLHRHTPRTDRGRAGYLLWGLWSVTMMGVFSFAQGTFHPYYTVILAPGVAALAGAGCVDLWRISSSTRPLVWVLPAAITGTAVWSGVLLLRVSGYAPGLPGAVIAAGTTGSVALLLALLRTPSRSLRRPMTYAALALSLLALGAGPAAYDLSTVARNITGNQAAAGPSAGIFDEATARTVGASGEDGAVDAISDSAVDEALLSYLQDHREGGKYLVAVETSANSVPIILATGEPVVTIGGYKGRDPVPTAERLASMVAAEEIHYAVLGSDAHLPGSLPEVTSANLDSVTAWILEHGRVVPPADYGGITAAGTLYYLP